MKKILALVGIFTILGSSIFTSIPVGAEEIVDNMDMANDIEYAFKEENLSTEEYLDIVESINTTEITYNGESVDLEGNLLDGEFTVVENGVEEEFSIKAQANSCSSGTGYQACTDMVISRVIYKPTGGIKYKMGYHIAYTMVNGGYDTISNVFSPFAMADMFELHPTGMTLDRKYENVSYPAKCHMYAKGAAPTVGYLETTLAHDVMNVKGTFSY